MSKTAKELINQVRAEASRTPEFIYTEQCRYVNSPDYEAEYEADDTPARPGCIVGVAMWNLGWIDGTISQYINNAGVGHVMRELDIDYTRTQREWLQDVQVKQDDGFAWGRVVEMADARKAMLLRQN